MSLIPERIAIVPNPEKQTWQKNTLELIDALKAYHVEILMESSFQSHLPHDRICFLPFSAMLEKAELMITIGGDGTILHAARHAAGAGVPLLGVNSGNLGYMTELDVGEYDGIRRVMEGDYTLDKRMMLEVSVLREERQTSRWWALNEAVVARGSILRTLHFLLFLDDAFITDYFCDGIIVATPTGTTAYSLSAGGPILEPGADSVIINPICAHSLFTRPVVVSDKRKISLKITQMLNKDAALTLDGDCRTALVENDMVVIKKSDLSLDLIRLKERSFYDILRQKMDKIGRNQP